MNFGIEKTFSFVTNFIVNDVMIVILVPIITMIAVMGIKLFSPKNQVMAERDEIR